MNLNIAIQIINLKTVNLFMPYFKISNLIIISNLYKFLEQNRD
jgi:hypothetical protein